MRFKLPARAAVILTGAMVLPSIAFAATLYQRTFVPKNGGSLCYAREYSDAFRKTHPNVKIQTISVERSATTMNGTPSGAKKFGVTFSASTASEIYAAHGDCVPKGAGFACSLESDGGIFNIVVTKPSIRIVTRRIEIEGLTKDLDISAAKGKPARSFELKGHKGLPCASVFD
jgi:hypothetical protein